MERAQARQPDFQPTRDTVGTLLQICRRLDGLPLAIEMAAARLPALLLPELAARLADHFNLLTTGNRTAEPHQQTLLATVEWSYNLLTTVEQILLRRLAVFAGGWTISAAEIVCQDEDLPPLTILDSLIALVDKSLVHRTPAGRYRMLETILQFASSYLQQNAEASSLAERHLAWCLDMAEEAEEGLQGHGQMRWLEQVQHEHENLRAALAYSLAPSSAHSEQGLRLAAALWRFWQWRGHLQEGRAWLDLAVACNPTTSPSLQAKAHIGCGALAESQGDYALAQAHYEQSVLLCHAAGNDLLLGRALAGLGSIALRLVDYQRSSVLLQEGITLQRLGQDLWGLATSLAYLGVLQRELQDANAARASFEESLQLRRTLGDQQGIAMCLSNLGLLALEQDAYAQAESLLSEGLALRRALNDRQGIARSLGHLALVAQHHAATQPKQAYRAATLWAESLVIRQELGDQRGILRALEGLAEDAIRYTLMHDQAI